MKRQDIIDQFRAEARKRMISSRNYEVWTVGKFRTIHVSCRHSYVGPLQSVAYHLTNLYGGIVYAAIRVPMGFSSHSNFCFKVGCSRKG